MKRLPLVLLTVLLLTAIPSHVQAQSATWPRTVVITNDDGIEAEGLLALVRAFAPVARVYVAAPLENRSGSTNYVSAIARRGIDVERRDLGEGIIAYGVDGYPADAVNWAINGLLAGDPPDLVISGVNTGPNLTDDWSLSGTVGAARLAALFGVRALAVSGWTSQHPETLEAVARWVVELSRSDWVRDLEPGQYLTVSVPRVAAADIAGVAVARRSPRDWNIAMERTGESSVAGLERWSLSFESVEISPPAGSDLDYYRQNMIAIVPMRVDEHDWDLLDALHSNPPALPAWPPAGGGR
ncbi:MAG TPA: 5'/3'-nucleotidase SurE [Gemmatimonadota bacterium]|nr:5'/3'-nucleotidase SurE [Gemmatimonadota bacterium]